MDKTATAMQEKRTDEASGLNGAADGEGGRRRRAKPPAPAAGAGSSGKAGRSRGKHNVDLGRRGEDAAACFLERRGYDIVERNWTCVAGEADIIARDGDAVVFVEVKTRSNCDKGMPAEAVDEAKRARYEGIAALFLRDFEDVDVPVRFDIVSILVIAPDRAMVRHHINAFSAQ